MKKLLRNFSRTVKKQIPLKDRPKSVNFQINSWKNLMEEHNYGQSIEVMKEITKRLSIDKESPEYFYSLDCLCLSYYKNRSQNDAEMASQNMVNILKAYGTNEDYQIAIRNHLNLMTYGNLANVI